MPIYTGKFTYKKTATADNENIIVDLPDGWVTHGRAHIWSTWTKDARGVGNVLAFGGDYCLRDVNDGATAFTLRDLDNKNFYWFTGTRNGNLITLSMLNEKNAVCQSNIVLKLHE